MRRQLMQPPHKLQLIMASKYLQKFPLLADFVQDVLRDQPVNIPSYAADYFELLEKGKKIDYQGPNRRQDILLQAKKHEDITKRAAQVASAVGQEHPQSGQHPQSGHPLPQPTPHSIASKADIPSQKTVTNSEVEHYMNTISSQIADKEGTFQKERPLSVTDEREGEEVVRGEGEDIVKESIEGVVNQLFESFDVDRSGYIESKQIKLMIDRVLSDVGEEQRAGLEAEIAQFIAEVDQNKDGRLSRQEMNSYVLALYARTHPNL